MNRLNSADKAPSLEEVGAILRAFLLPCISGDSLTKDEIRSWTPNHGWSTAKADTSSGPAITEPERN